MSNYFSVKAISNSSLGYIDFETGGSPRKFKEYIDGTLKEEEQSYQRTGTMVHMSVLEPEKFKVADIERPSDTICTIVDELFSRIGANDFALPGSLSDYQATLSVLVDEFAYQTNWKPETRINKVIELGKDYFEYLKMVKTSQEIVLTSKEHATVMACGSSLKTDPHISRIMFPTDIPEGVEILREKEIYFEYGGYKCKAKLDEVIVNHNRKQYTIVDLKTTSKGVHVFNQYFNIYQYSRQFGFYDEALQAEYPGYTLNTAVCVAVETTGYNRARLFIVPNRVVEAGKKRVQRLFSVINVCMETGNWEYEPEYLESPYEISLL